MSTTNANVFEAAKCLDRWDLFDSALPSMHRRAKQLCDQCPVLESCRRRRDDMLADNRTMAWLAEGTWAGELLGSKVSDVA